MARILANDGFSEAAKQMLIDAGHEVVTEKIEQDDLMSQLNAFDGIIVRSATTVRQPLIDACPNLKFIGRAGVGMDNIDVEYARSIGRHVANTPAASSASVAELAIAHMLTLSRFLHASNQDMPERGVQDFKALKKSYSKGTELAGKTLGVIGGGRIGVETIRRAAGLGMNVKVFDPGLSEVSFSLLVSPDLVSSPVEVKLPVHTLDEVLFEADILTLHVPNIGRYLIGAEELSKMKDGAILINCARGGVVDESALMSAMESGKISFAGVDVFEKEPTDNQALLSHPATSVTPHIGGSTVEAQNRIGSEMAQQIIDFFK